jgi:hypothetical protein
MSASRYPFAANSRAMAAPMPLPAAVTIATFSISFAPSFASLFAYRARYRCAPALPAAAMRKHATDCARRARQHFMR